jgi:hypothetical protein
MSLKVYWVLKIEERVRVPSESISQSSAMAIALKSMAAIVEIAGGMRRRERIAGGRSGGIRLLPRQRSKGDISVVAAEGESQRVGEAWLAYIFSQSRCDPVF